MSQELRALREAITLRERFDFSVIPISESKIPAIKWSEYQDRKATFSELADMPFYNLGIVTGEISGIVVVDCDSREAANRFWKEVSKTTAVVTSKRGHHFYFRHPGELVMNGCKINGYYDVRGDGGYVMAPPSVHSEGEYFWRDRLISLDDLPVFDPSWRPESRYAESDNNRIKDAVAYISKIYPVSTKHFPESGNGRDRLTFRAACVLREGGLSESEALLAIMRWNQTNVTPPETDTELLRKIKCAYSTESKNV